MKLAIVLLALSLILPLGGKAFADNDRRPVGKSLKLHEAVSKKMGKKGRSTWDVEEIKTWLVDKTFTGTAKVKPAKKKKGDLPNLYSISASYADGLMTDEAQRFYDQNGSGEYLIRVTYKKVNGKLYAEIQKMWPLKK